MVSFGFPDALSLAQTIGIIGTLILTLYFSKRQIQALSSDTETRVLNDLDEKLHRMAEIVMADPSRQKMVSDMDEQNYQNTYGISAKEVAFSYYTVICADPLSAANSLYLDIGRPYNQKADNLG